MPTRRQRVVKRLLFRASGTSRVWAKSSRQCRVAFLLRRAVEQNRHGLAQAPVQGCRTVALGHRLGSSLRMVSGFNRFQMALGWILWPWISSARESRASIDATTLIHVAVASPSILRFGTLDNWRIKCWYCETNVIDSLISFSSADPVGQPSDCQSEV
jgi:hypothetical protein